MSDLAVLLKRAFELARPNLRGFYRIVRKGRIVRTYASDGSYYADVQPLRNDESPDPAEPVIPQVELPVIWGGPNRGIVCPPAAGTLCDIEYYDGDPNYPRISNIRWQGNQAPAAMAGEFVIQAGPGVKAWFGADGKFHIEAPEATITASSVKITGNVEITGGLAVSGPSTLGGGGAVTGDLSVSRDVTCRRLTQTG